MVYGQRRIPTFTSAPLEEDLQVAGNIVLVLYASSDQHQHRLLLPPGRPGCPTTEQIPGMPPKGIILTRGWLKASHACTKSEELSKPVPPVLPARQAAADRAGQDLQVRDRGLAHQQRVQEGAPHPHRRGLRRLPASRLRRPLLRHQSGHRHLLPRQGPSVARDPAGDPGRRRRTSMEHAPGLVTLQSRPQPIEIDLARTAVICIDMQNAFVREGRHVRPGRVAHPGRPRQDRAEPQGHRGRAGGRSEGRLREDELQAGAHQRRRTRLAQLLQRDRHGADARASRVHRAVDRARAPGGSRSSTSSRPCPASRSCASSATAVSWAPTSTWC